MGLRPLEGFVVGVTADRRWKEQAELLERRGATVVHGPTIDTLYLADDDDLRQATVQVIGAPPDYLVATTGIGVRAWFEAASAWGIGDALAKALGSARIVARGPKAAAAITATGMDVWARSSTERMDDVLAILLAEPLRDRRVVLQEFGTRSPEVTAAMAGAGAIVQEVPVYRWRLPDDPAAAVRLVEAACGGRVDAVTFTSAPAVHNLFAIASGADAADELRAAFNRGGVVAACVGPVCAAGALEEGITSPLAPDVGRLGLLVRALSDHLEARRRTLRLDGGDMVMQGSAIEVDGVSAELTPKERAVLEVLASKPGTVISRETILDRVWGSADADAHVLEVTVGRLRRRLGSASAAVQVSPGRGYRLATN